MKTESEIKERIKDLKLDISVLPKVSIKTTSLKEIIKHLEWVIKE